MTAIRSKCGYSRDLFGLELERQLPGGIRSRWQRDHSADRSSTRSPSPVAPCANAPIEWEPNDRLQSIIDSLKGAVRFGHDALGNSRGRAMPTGPPNCACPTRSATCSAAKIARTAATAPQVSCSSRSMSSGRTTVFAYDAEGNLIEKLTQHG